MKTMNYIQLDSQKVENVVNGLQQLLADFQVHYTNLRGFHWNIKGQLFFVLHAKFEDLYNDAAEKVDQLAERILMLGGVPEHNFSRYLKTSNVKESGYVSGAEEALADILGTYSYFISEERKLLASASEAGDEVTVSMMSNFLEEQEKMVWMLQAFMSK